uniref:Beta-1,4 N-acetylgalactosaminyltransferase 2-like n=1 Tax=Saccoglossus kowalevskii TaxID=10224 RepID=A0ABM0GT56_SACKO|nr:PREDICTED: beta-1,4 N-acetylgalactosaminyltransferase 2-like [Saccoglossus kowalevskii]
MGVFSYRLSSLLMFSIGFITASLIHLHMFTSPVSKHQDTKLRVEHIVPDKRSVKDSKSTVGAEWIKYTTNTDVPTLSDAKLMMDMNRYRAKCSCPTPPFWYKAANERRLKESKLWKNEMDTKRAPLAICKAFSPFIYVSSGITVEPFNTVPIVGLSLSPAVEHILKQSNMSQQVILYISAVNNYGIFTMSDGPQYDGIIDGSKTSSLKINVLGKDVNEINNLLSKVIYTGTVYHIDAYDKIQVSFLNFTIDINLHIKRPPLPDLIDPGASGSVVEKLTVITKTFERPDVVKRFIDSVHHFYPNMTIIVADDSQQPIPIKKDHVKYYTMAFRDGNYPGVNLALSQVETKYVLYSDDDYVFTNETRLELMLEKLENPLSNIDIVIPHVPGLPLLGSMWKFAYNENGTCFTEYWDVEKEKLNVPGYPQCRYGDMFENFVMCNTVLFRKIGYYPPIKTSTHAEFWINTVGKARCAKCVDVIVSHDHVRNPVYNKFRNEAYKIEKKRDPSPLFDNDLCISKFSDFRK